MSIKAIDTIAAVCTPQGRSGGVSIIRVSGPEALVACSTISKLRGGLSFVNCLPNSILFGEVVDPRSGQTIDQCLFCVFRAPKSFTGLEVIEINCHSNPLICQKILSLLAESGVRQARPGEFSEQAFFNGKIDLIQAEAICELVSANNSVALQKSMEKLKSGLSREIVQIYKCLLELLASMEASFEFLEEEERDLDFKNIVRQAFDRLRVSTKLVFDSVSSTVDFNRGAKIVLVGIPNAGKSTLFNQLVGADRAIVSSVAGTTRDYIDSGLIFKGQYWSLVDTAGLRQTTDTVEQMGIVRSENQAQAADLVVCLLDPTSLGPEQSELAIQMQKSFSSRVIFVQTKADLVPKAEFTFFKGGVDCKVGQNLSDSIEQLRSIIWERINTQQATGSSIFMLNLRQREILKHFCQVLETVEVDFLRNLPYEVIIPRLNDCAQSLSNLTGKSVQEDVYDEVFSKFCVGK